MYGSVSTRDLVTCRGVVKVGGRGCFVAGIWLRLWGVVNGAKAAGDVAVAFVVDDGPAVGGWCCCSVGSLNCARGSARSGVSGFRFGGSGCVVRHARKIVVDGRLLLGSKGRARALRNADRENMTEEGVTDGLSSLSGCDCDTDTIPKARAASQWSVGKVEARRTGGFGEIHHPRKWPRGLP